MAKLQAVFRGVNRFLSRNSAEIMTGIGVAGVIATSVLAVKGSREAEIIEEDLYQARFDQMAEDPTKLELAKAVLPVYVPCILTGATTIACIIGASAVHSRRNAVLAGLYSASEIAMTEYREKIAQTFGEKKERRVRDDIAKDRIERNPVSSNQVIVTGKGDSLCYDSWSGRYFTSDIEKIRSIQNTINRDVIAHMWSSVNDLYFLLGLGQIKGGENVGWNVDNLLDFSFSSHIADDGRPCLVVEYQPKPYAL